MAFMPVLFLLSVLLSEAETGNNAKQDCSYEEPWWTYEKFDNWGDSCKTSEIFNRQSPITIDTTDLSCMRGHEWKLLFNNYDEPSYHVKFSNDGRMLHITFDCGKLGPQLKHGMPFTIVGSQATNEGAEPEPEPEPQEEPFPFGKWHLADIEIHWPSQHTIKKKSNNAQEKRYDLEMTLVFYNDLFESYEEANTKSSNETKLNFVNLSILFEICSTDNPKLDQVLKQLRNVNHAGKTVDGQMRIRDLQPPHFDEKYFYYLGSTTYPNCVHITQQYILKAIQTIGTKQFDDTFNHMYSTTEDKDKQQQKRLINNYRPIQDRQNRLVYEYPHENSKPVTILP